MSSSCTPTEYEQILALNSYENARDEVQYLKEAVKNFRSNISNAFETSAKYVERELDAQPPGRVTRGKLRCIFEFWFREKNNLGLIEGIQYDL